jgi:hypothetical protein
MGVKTNVSHAPEVVMQLGEQFDPDLDRPSRCRKSPTEVRKMLPTAA